MKIDFLNSLTSTWGIISTLLAVFLTGVGALAFLEKRRREDMKTVEGKIGASATDRDGQFSELEDDLGKLKARVEQIDGRIGDVERNLETVARSKDIAELRTEMAAHNGSVSTAITTVQGQLSILYQAALRASE